MFKKWKVKQVTRANFTYEEILDALEVNDFNLADSAKALSKLGRGKVSRQLLNYWVKTEDFDTVNTEFYEAEQLVAKTRAQANARQARREVKVLTESILKQQTFEEAIRLAFEEISPNLPMIAFQKFNEVEHTKGTKLTVELLVSDLQIGKLTGNYNTTVAINRILEVGRKAVQSIIQKKEAGYEVERIIISFLGDIIESDEKHPDSARGCDSATSEQMANAIKYLYELILVPLAKETPRLDCIGIVGNHDWNGNGLRSFKAGLTSLSYPIYKALELLCTNTIPHSTWSIPYGVFHVDNIYGSNVLYEHGVGVAVTEQAMKKRKTDRGEQVGKHIFYFRSADKHNISTFNNAQYVVNGAFFGGGSTGSEYSEQVGYHSQAGQWLGFHCKREDARTTLFDSYVIQLGHIGE